MVSGVQCIAICLKVFLPNVFSLVIFYSLIIQKEIRGYISPISLHLS